MQLPPQIRYQKRIRMHELFGDGALRLIAGGLGSDHPFRPIVKSCNSALECQVLVHGRSVFARADARAGIS